MVVRQPESPEGGGNSGEQAAIPWLVARYDIDHFLLDEDGAAEMQQLQMFLDRSPSMVEELHQQLLTTLDNRDPNIISILLGEHDNEGIRRDEINRECFQNQTTLAIIRLINISKHNGDMDAVKAYQDLLRIMLNFIRFDMLLGEYKTDDDKWNDRAVRIGRFSGNVLHMHLGPGVRNRTVTRSSPSGYLSRFPQHRRPGDSENNYRG